MSCIVGKLCSRIGAVALLIQRRRKSFGCRLADKTDPPGVSLNGQGDLGDGGRCLRGPWCAAAGLVQVQAVDQVFPGDLGKGVVDDTLKVGDHLLLHLGLDGLYDHVVVLADELVGPLGHQGEVAVKQVVHLDVGVRDVKVQVGVPDREALVAAWTRWNDVGLKKRFTLCTKEIKL